MTAAVAQLRIRGVPTFTNERARRQVERLVDYAAFPGLCVLADPEGHVLVQHGELPGIETRRLAELVTLLTPVGEVGASIDADILTLAAAPLEHYGLVAGLRAGYRLCVVVPNRVPATVVHRLLAETRERLVAMMAQCASGDGGPPRDANSLWTFAVPPDDSPT